MKEDRKYLLHILESVRRIDVLEIAPEIKGCTASHQLLVLHQRHIVSREGTCQKSPLTSDLLFNDTFHGKGGDKEVEAGGGAFQAAAGFLAGVAA